MSLLAVGAAAAGISSLAKAVANFTKPDPEDDIKKAPTEAEQKAGTEATQEAFLDYARMSVAERLREQLLKSKGLTEEDLAAMDPDKRAALEKEIGEDIRTRLLKETGKQTGGIANLLV
ncbi:hypothetical protein [Ferrovibrio sp.]|uniref:hypothetical protein n=1 Tax=Ferrovibrio sp. TaxID=1917215 RepID=UPI0025C5DBF1|nr:hypothetical protein [Ferrovibrio sp.]MBX3455629.1 hypothetical protein [Ferrovibrio sp.]